MGAIRGYIAASLDGHVADAAGGVDWLKPWEGVDYGYDAFIAEIGAVVMGRTTYAQIPSFGVGWPYPGKRGVVVSRSAGLPEFEGVEIWPHGLEGLPERLRALPGGDVWVVGGARLQAGLIAAGALDRLEVFVVPVLLGAGVKLFPEGTVGPRRIELAAASEAGGGLARLDYRFR